MPRYRFTYLLETPISAERDVTFDHGGSAAHLSFANRIDENHIHLQAVAEGQNWLEANELLMDDVVSPVLDAISLHRKAPMMLQDLLLVVKAENGHVRKAVVIDHNIQNMPVALGDAEIGEIESFLKNRPALSHAVMRWLRYCYRPITVLERFVFSWLSFENRAGTMQVRRQCPECRKDLPSFPGLNRDEAYEVLRKEHPAMSRAEFDITFRHWSWELRNPVFHGGKAVSTKMRTEMQQAMDFYRVAVEHDLQRQAGYRLAYPGLHPQDGSLRVDIHHFVEYRTDDVNLEFADPPHREALLVMVEKQELPKELTLLDMNTAKHW